MNKRFFYIVTPLITLLIFQFSGFAYAKSSYQLLVDLGTYNPSYANGINDNLNVVGQGIDNSNNSHAVMWTAGKIIDLGNLGGTWAYATAINNKNQVIGYSGTGSGSSAGFLWQNNTMTNLGNFDPTAISNNGNYIVGDCYNNPTNACIDHNGSITYIGTLGGNVTIANGVNNKGQVAGWSRLSNGLDNAILWYKGKLVDIGTLGGNESHANGINNSGVIVGWSDLSDGEQHAFEYKDNTMTDLGSSGLHSIAQAINNKGVVVGYSDTSSSTNNFAAEWDNKGLVYLNSTTGAGSTASAINNNGDIAGYDNGASQPFLYIK